MDNHPIENLMRTTLENIRDMIDVNTIIGDAFETTEGTVIIPISKVSIGFASGGASTEQKIQKDENGELPFGGGSGAGVSLKPVGFLVCKNNETRLLSVDHENSLDRIIDNVPQIMDTVKNLFSKEDKKQ